MRSYIASKLYKIADWLDVPVHDWETPLMTSAKQRILAAEGFDASGEYKRHLVYSALIKEFPAEKHYQLAFAIERVIQMIR